MSKVTLKVEIDEETYKQIKSDSVCSNNNECIISKSSLAYYALNAIINATPITESNDAVSRQAIIDMLTPYINENKNSNDLYLAGCGDGAYHSLCAIKSLSSALPKREENTVSEEVYTEEYTRRKALEYENYVLKQNMQALR